MKQKYYYYILPVIGTLFCLWYIKAASCNVVYTDYIRLVNSYLPDVFSAEKFFVPDVLTRMPVNYLERIINVKLFGFNTMFDMALGVVCLGLSGVVFISYLRRQKISPLFVFIIMAVMFSLNKWEMLNNGSGWVHFLAFVCFYYHYNLIDRATFVKTAKYDEVILMALPFITTLGIAGPYCAVYTAMLFLTYGYLYIINKDDRRKNIKRFICALIPFLFYLWSNAYAVSDHADAVSGPMLPVLIENPVFFLKLLVKSFSTMILGEQLMLEKDSLSLGLPDDVIYCLGIIVIIAYLLALILQLRYKLYKKTILPIICILAGLMNHLLITVSRWIFLKENYAMSSRYSLQFQIGVIGIILTFGLLWNQINLVMIRSLAAVMCALFLFGNAMTTCREIKMAPYREEYMENIAKTALRFEEESDDVLRETFEYRRSRPDSGAKVRAALTILKENNLNVFR